MQLVSKPMLSPTIALTGRKRPMAHRASTKRRSVAKGARPGPKSKPAKSPKRSPSKGRSRYKPSGKKLSPAAQKKKDKANPVHRTPEQLKIAARYRAIHVDKKMPADYRPPPKGYKTAGQKVAEQREHKPKRGILSGGAAGRAKAKAAGGKAYGPGGKAKKTTTGRPSRSASMVQTLRNKRKKKKKK